MVDPNLFARLEAMGLVAVKHELAMGKVNRNNPDHYNAVVSWVKLQDDALAAEEESKRDARKERTLTIAEDALSMAKEANRIASDDLSIARDSARSARANARWAMYAAITAVVAAAISTKDQILALIFPAP